MIYQARSLSSSLTEPSEAPEALNCGAARIAARIEVKLYLERQKEESNSKWKIQILSRLQQDVKQTQ